MLFREDVKHDDCSQDEHLVMPTHQQFVQRYFQLQFSSKSFSHHAISQSFIRQLLYMQDRIIRLSVSWPSSACVRELPVALLQRNLFLRIYKSAVFYKGFILQSLESIGLFSLFFLILVLSVCLWLCFINLQYNPYKGFLTLAPLNAITKYLTVDVMLFIVSH